MINKVTIHKRFYLIIGITVSFMALLYFVFILNFSSAFASNRNLDIVQKNNDDEGLVVPATAIGVADARTGDIIFSDSLTIDNPTTQKYQLSNLEYTNKTDKLSLISQHETITKNTYQTNMIIDNSKDYDMYDIQTEKSVESDNIIINPNTSQSLEFNGKFKSRGDIGDLFSGITLGNVNFSFKALISTPKMVLDLQGNSKFYYDYSSHEGEGRIFDLSETSGCTWENVKNNIKTIEFDSSFKVSKIINLNNWFSNCYNLTSVNLSNLNITNALDLSCMFTDCISLKNIDLSSLITNPSANTYEMFTGCDFDSIKIGNGWGLNLADCGLISRLGAWQNSQGDIFTSEEIPLNKEETYMPFNIVFVNLNAFNDGYWTDLNGNRINNLRGQAGEIKSAKFVIENKDKELDYIIDNEGNLYTSTNNTIQVTIKENLSISIVLKDKIYDAKAVLDANGCFIFYYDDTSHEGEGRIFDLSETSGCTWENVKNNIKTIEFDSSFKVSKIINLNNWFRNCYNLTSVNLSNLNITNALDLSCMFTDCISLKNIDLSSLITNPSANTYEMFTGCDFDSIKIGNGWGLNLANCGLISRLGAWQNSQGDIFTSEEIPLNKEETYMPFNIVFVNLNAFNDGYWTDLNGNRINNLRGQAGEIKSAKFVIENKDKELDYIIDNEGNLYTSTNNTIQVTIKENLSISIVLKDKIYDAKAVLDANGCFRFYYDDTSHEGEGRIYPFDETSGCLWDDIKAQIKTVNFDSSMQQANIVNCSNWFRNCYNLTSVNLSNLNITNALDLSCMFTDCISLKNIDLSSLITNPSANTYEMFTGCDFDSIKIGNGWGLNLANCGLISRLGAWQNSQGDIFTSEEIPLNKEDVYIPVQNKKIFFYFCKNLTEFINLII